MESEKQLPLFRAGRYCTTDSKYSYKAFVRASQIYGYIVRCGSISLTFGRKLPSPLIYEDLVQYNPIQSRERREALILLFDTLKYENVYNEVLKNRSIFPNEYAEFKNLAVIVLHDMTARFLVPGICKYREDTAIAHLEDHFNEKRMAIWEEFSKIKLRNKVEDLEDMSNLKYERYDLFKTAPFLAWVNTKRLKADSVAKTLRQLGYEARLVIRNLDSIVDMPNVVKVKADSRQDLLNESMVTESVAVVDDIAACMGPHCFLNALFEIERKKFGFHRDGKVQKLSNIFGNSDVLVTDSGNGLIVAHLATLLQASGFKGRIFAFNAGTDKEITRCKTLIDQMKIRKVYFYSKKLPDLWILDYRLKKVKAAYVNPRCSKSAIVNPISYLPSQDTDFEFLSDIYHDRQRDITSLIVNQHKTLKFCTMIPGIELLFYTTNSIHEMENESVIQTAIAEVSVSKREGEKNDPAEIGGSSEVCPEYGLCESLGHVSFEVLHIPVDTSGHVKAGMEQIKILPTEEQNGCYFAAICRR